MEFTQFRMFKKYVILIIVIIIFVMGFINYIENKLIFHPDNDLDSTPENYGLEYDDVAFHTDDGVKLHGWFIYSKKVSQYKDTYTLLWFHGNAGNIGHRLENIEMLCDRIPVNIFIFDYRQFGKSEGKISEKGTYLDAKAALAYLNSRKDINVEKIIFLGRSLGSAVAIDLALKEKCRALILETPFTSIKEMCKVLHPILPLHCVVRTKYDSIAKIKNVKTPVLIIHGDKDDYVPIEQGRKLYEAANEPKEFYTVPGGTHNGIYIEGGEEYFNVIKRFVNKLENVEW